MCHTERKMRPYCGLNPSSGGSKQSFNLLTKMISRFKYISSVDTRERMEKLAPFKISKTLRCKASFIILSSTGFVVHNKPWNLIFFVKFSCKKHAKTVKMTIYPYARPSPLSIIHLSKISTQRL